MCDEVPVSVLYTRVIVDTETDDLPPITVQHRRVQESTVDVDVPHLDLRSINAEAGES